MPIDSSIESRFDLVLSRLQNVRGSGQQRDARCPSHDDRENSLSVRLTTDRILLHCHAGCDTADIVRAMDLEMKDLYLSNGQSAGYRLENAQEVYDYTDASGNKVEFRVARFGPPKTFRPFHRQNGSWILGQGGVERIPYRLPCVMGAMWKGERIYVVEGERDVENLERHGLVATTNSGGAGKWVSSWGRRYFRNAVVVILPDNDKPGRDHAEDVAKSMCGHAHSIKVVALPDLPEHGDVTEWLRTGRTREDLERLVEQAPEWAPKQEEDSPSKDDHHFTDLGNARRLIDRHGADLRYVSAWQTWLVYDGKRWARDETGEVARRAKETVRAMYAEAVEIEDDKERKALVSWAKTSENEKRIKPMLASAATEPEVVARPRDFDADPLLFNCSNGTLDLRTGELREHRRVDLITKMSPVVYDPEATSERWERFLADLTGGDGELGAFLQRAVGYALTGDTSEEVLFMLIGPTNTGKSSFVDAINGALGDYAVVADFESFLARRFVGGIRNDIARLAGARFVSSVEVDEGKKLAEGLVKMITGGDVVTARMLYKEAFEFRPQFKLFLAANHPPQVSDEDDAMWRRIRRVPCDHTLPAENVDKTMKPELRDPKRGGPAVLAWAVQGCLEWQQEGLGMAPAIAHATQAYRADMDRLGDFIEDCCTLHEGAWVVSKRLWDAYESWARANGERRLLSRKAFGMRLKERRCQDKRQYVGPRQLRCWLGIGLADG